MADLIHLSSSRKTRTTFASGNSSINVCHNGTPGKSTKLDYGILANNLEVWFKKTKLNFEINHILPVALYPHLFPGPKRLRIAFRPSSLVPHQTLFHSLECLVLKIRFSPNIFEIVELT